MTQNKTKVSPYCGFGGKIDHALSYQFHDITYHTIYTIVIQVYISSFYFTKVQTIYSLSLQVSVTSLLEHSVTQPPKSRLLPKKLIPQTTFLI